MRDLGQQARSDGSEQAAGQRPDDCLNPGAVPPSVTGTRLCRYARLLLGVSLGPAIVIGFSACTATPTRQEIPSADHQLKADYLLRLAEWISWPTNTPGSAQERFVMGVVGDSPLAQAIRRSAVNQVKGRPLEIREFKIAQQLRRLATPKSRAGDLNSPRARTQQELHECQLLFVGVEKENQLQWALRAVESQPILTVGETPTFARGGGMIGLLGAPPDMQLEVNMDALRRARIAVSPKLLRLARVLSTPRDQSKEAR